MARLLVVEKHFIQGFGGTPESVLLLANHLERAGIAVDVLSSEGLCRDAGSLQELAPRQDAVFDQPRRVQLADYQAIFIAGSWNPKGVGIAFRALRSKVPVSYAAKGNLCAVEFTRVRDLKKLAFLVSFELVPLLVARRVVFSSDLERRYSLLPRAVKRKGVLLPELFRIPTSEDPPAADYARKPGQITFGFLAEISPRKGLIELIAGFLQWLDQNPQIVDPILRIAGDPRPGSERYLSKAKKFARRHRLGDRVIWEDGKRGDARTAFYREVDVFICPSRFESFGLTPLESLWQGTPVLCGPRIGCLERLPSECGCRTFADLSPLAIATGLEEARRDIAQLAARAAASRPRIAGAFGGEALVSDFVQALFLKGSNQAQISS